MVRPGIEEGIEMNEDVQREFVHVREGQKRIEESLKEQSRNLSDHFKKFQQHVYDDQRVQADIANHMAEHAEAKKHRWAIYSGVILTAVSTLGMLIVEIIKYAISMKG